MQITRKLLDAHEMYDVSLMEFYQSVYHAERYADCDLCLAQNTVMCKEQAGACPGWLNFLRSRFSEKKTA